VGCIPQASSTEIASEEDAKETDTLTSGQGETRCEFGEGESGESCKA
jgi:hypothetical protein